MHYPARIIHWSFYALFFTVPLFFLASTSELFELNKMLLTYVFTTLIVSAWAADCILQKRLVFRRTPLDWPILIFLISQSLSFLFSISTHVSWHGYYSRFNGGLASLLAYSVLYWAAVTYMDRRNTLYVIRYTLISAVLVSLYGILERLGLSISCIFTTGTWDVSCWVQDVQNRVFATLGQPNWMAAYLTALIFLPLSRILASKKNWSTGQLINWLTTAGLFAALLFTRSRSGILAFGISSIIFWSITLFQFPPLKLRGGSKGVILFGVWCLMLTVLTFATSNPLRDYLIRPFVKNPPPTTAVQPPPAQSPPAETVLESGGITESGNIRKIVWTGAANIWKSSAKTIALGTGPETFAMSYYRFRPSAHNATTEWELLYNKAHNEFLNYLANTGLLGLSSYLILLIAMSTVLLNFRFTIFNFQTNSNSQILKKNLKINKFENYLVFENWLIKLALLSGWISIMITNFWGFSVVIVQTFLFLFPAMAIALNTEYQIPNSERVSLSNFQIFALFIPFFSGLYILYSIFNYWFADVTYAEGQYNLRAFTATQEPGYLIASYQKFADAYRQNPNEPSISSDLSITAAYMALATRELDSTGAASLAKLAVSASDKSVSINSHHPNLFKNRSRMFILLSDIEPKNLDLADQALAKAAELSPTDPRIPYNRGIIATYAGSVDLARRHFEAALALKPDFNDPRARLSELENQ